MERVEQLIPVCWWDMQQFAGENLQTALAILGKIECNMLNYRPTGDVGAAIFMGAIVLPVKERETLEQEALCAVERTLKAIGLNTTALAVCELRTVLINHRISAYARIGPADVAARIQEIQRTCRREMTTSVFLHLSAEQAGTFKNPTEEWQEAILRWPKVRGDIEESLRCLALDRYAASVFHILLVAEFGVIQIATLFGVQGDRPGWGALDRLEKNTKEKLPGSFRA